MEDQRIPRGRHAPEKQMLARRMRREMTSGEWYLWQRLRANRFDGLHFRRQQVIDGFIADFYCHAARLVVEVDGDVHEEQEEYDAERDSILAVRGLRVFRVTNARLDAEIETVLDELRQIVSR